LLCHLADAELLGLAESEDVPHGLSLGIVPRGKSQSNGPFTPAATLSHQSLIARCQKIVKIPTMAASVQRDTPFNPAVLKWARERRRLDPEDAARRAAVAIEKIFEWEGGRSKPTVRQARQLADLYDRPFLEFFEPNIPELPTPTLAPDFRFHRTPPSQLELRTLEAVQEWAESQRLNAIDLYEEIGETPPRFPRQLHRSIGDDPEKVAADIRQILNFPVEQQLALRSNERHKFPSMLRRLLESAGVLVLKESGLIKARTRGICLYDEVLPVIVFTNEAPGGQAFTLMHEFAHVMLGKSAISWGIRGGGGKGSPGKRIENWCNSVAAAFLMPRDAITAHPASPREYRHSISDIELRALAASFAVSRHAMLVRLISLGLVDPWYYWRVKRPAFLQEESEYTASGRSPYYGSRYRSALGDQYTGLVLEALETGRIGYQSAAEFMGIKNVRHLIDVRDHFGR
jgi:Zn-dependent peptidase ImmA (M78 family)/transcriptional regulator with XRE-family HTH domain